MSLSIAGLKKYNKMHKHKQVPDLYKRFDIITLSFRIIYTKFTWLNAAVTINQINAAIIQGQPLIKGSVYTIKQFLGAVNIQC